MSACLGTALEVIKPEFFLKLLMRLLKDPARLDGHGQVLVRGIRRQVREVTFPLIA